jgi:CubicO group peptidase (beta-lactamase class C family)
MRSCLSSRFFSAAFAATLALQSLPALAQTSASSKPTMDDAIAAIKAYAPEALKEQGAPGMSVAITDRTHTIAIVTAGLADVASNTPVTDGTRFPIGSISKSMTTLALLQLHDQGLVDLNARVQKYLPDWSIQGDGTPILVHELLSHTGGTPDDYSFQQYGFAIADLRNAHTIFKPGTEWEYSNDGFATIGAIVAQISGKPWATSIEQHVFAPIGMTNSFAVFTPRTLAETATGYEFRDSDAVATPPNPALMASAHVDFVDPAGSVISTAGDMARYLRLYLNGGKTEDGKQLISPASFTAMTNVDRFSDGKPVTAKAPELAEWPSMFMHYGYGVAVQHEGGDHLIGHTGGISGFTACFQDNLTRGFGVIALSNLVEAPLHPCQIVKYAMAVLRAQSLGQPLPPAPTGPPIAAPTITAADYAGSFTQSGARVGVAANADNTLTLNDAGTAYRLVPHGHDLFWTDDPRFTTYYVHFERNANKKVDAFTNGSAFYTGAGYTGPKTFSHPKAWDTLAGRYEGTVFGSSINIRIVIVKDKLTMDGLQPLKPLPNGTFSAGDSTVRFDTSFQGKMQRMWLDGADLYRIELP